MHVRPYLLQESMNHISDEQTFQLDLIFIHCLFFSVFQIVKNLWKMYHRIRCTIRCAAQKYPNTLGTNVCNRIRKTIQRIKIILQYQLVSFAHHIAANRIFQFRRSFSFSFHPFRSKMSKKKGK